MPPTQDAAGRSLIDRYDREAPDYRDLWAPTLRIAGRRLLGELAQHPAHWVVDVATGVGSLLPDLRASFPSARIVGVDRSRGMLTLVSKEFPIAVMDATRLGVASGSVDLVLLAFVLFHLQEPGQGLLEAHRILTATGRVGCITWAGDLLSTAGRIWADCLDAHGAPPGDPAAISRHEAVDTPPKMEQLLRGVGFQNVRSWEEELVDRFDLERLLRLRTTLGAMKPRFDGLAPDARAACFSAARQRMESLTPDEFVARGKVVYSIAYR